MNDQPVYYLGNPMSAKYVRKAARTRARFTRKYGYDKTRRYTLALADNPVIGPALGVRNIVAADHGDPIDPERGVAIGNIRMGYGHYRIAMAVASAANALGRIPYWFDLLGFDSPGAKMIHDLDYWYSLGSRLSQKSRLFNRFVWDPLMGSAYRRLEKNYPIREACTVFADVYQTLPEGLPFLGTHPWCAHGAVHAGRRGVINMIPDNWPLGFHLADGAINTVQSFSSYFRFRMLLGMGRPEAPLNPLPASLLRLTGHYIDHELVVNVEEDCARRVARAEGKGPIRFLISVGGAGAQQNLLTAVVRHLMPYIRDGRAVLFLNFGDHRSLYEHFRSAISGFDDDAQMHTNWEETAAFAAGAVTGDARGLHAFLHEDTFAAVYATNVLMRASDVLVTKPSELAFYPIPKLLLERVGGHEAWGAVRASEIGDGTTECPDTATTLQVIDRYVEETDLLRLQCEHILKQRTLGVYDGGYRVVELAIEAARA